MNQAPEGLTYETKRFSFLMEMPEFEIKTISFAKDAVIVVQNANNPGLFFIIRSGRVRIDSEHMAVDHDLAYYNPGDSFGLVSAMTEHKYLVSLFADTDVELYQIPIQVLGSYLKQNKDLAMKILHLYSKELRALQRHLSNANKPADRDFHPEKLLYNAKTYLSWKKPNYAGYALKTYLDWGILQDISGEMEEAKALVKENNLKYVKPEWKNGKAVLRADEVLFIESENSDDIYIIIEGSVKLFSIVRGNEYVIDILTSGEIFGEMSLIDNAPRMASAVTDSDSLILKVSAENLFESVGDSLLQKIFESIARRIWFSHQRLVILKIKIPVIRLYAYLYNSIRNQDIRLRKRNDFNPDAEHIFTMTFEELCSLCAIYKIKRESVQDFFRDSNIVIGKGTITVKNRKRLEDRLGTYRTREGQIANILD